MSGNVTPTNYFLKLRSPFPLVLLLYFILTYICLKRVSKIYFHNEHTHTLLKELNLAFVRFSLFVPKSQRAMLALGHAAPLRTQCKVVFTLFFRIFNHASSWCQRRNSFLKSYFFTLFPPLINREILTEISFWDF